MSKLLHYSWTANWNVWRKPPLVWFDQKFTSNHWWFEIRSEHHQLLRHQFPAFGPLTASAWGRCEGSGLSKALDSFHFFRWRMEKSSLFFSQLSLFQGANALKKILHNQMLHVKVWKEHNLWCEELSLVHLDEQTTRRWPGFEFHAGDYKTLVISKLKDKNTKLWKRSNKRQKPD